MLKNFRKKYDQTDLYEAVKRNDKSFVEKNLSNIEIKYGGYSVLNAAVNENNIDILKILLEDNRFEPQAKDYRPIMTASAYGRLNMLLLLLNDKRVNYEEVIYDAVELAIKNNHEEILEYFLKEKNLNIFKHKPEILSTVLERDNKESRNMAEMLIDNQYFNPSKNYDDDLAFAISLRNMFVINKLMEHPLTNPSRYNNELIKEAYKKNDEELLELLFQHPEIKRTLKSNNLELYRDINNRFVSDKLKKF